MSLSLVCPACGSRVKAPDQAAGKQVKCPKPGCGQAISVPAAPGKPIAAPPPVPNSPSQFPLAVAARDDHPSPPTAERPGRPGLTNRTLLYVAVGGGVAAVVFLVLVLALVSGFGQPNATVEVAVNWKTDQGVKTVDDPVVILVPKGTRTKIDEIAPVYAGVDYKKAREKSYRATGAYLEVGAEGKAWLEVPRGSYTLIVFPNSTTHLDEADVSEAEALRAEKKLREFFMEVRLDKLRRRPVFIQEVEVRGSGADVRHDFRKSASDKVGSPCPTCEGGVYPRKVRPRAALRPVLSYWIYLPVLQFPAIPCNSTRDLATEREPDYNTER